MTATTLCYEYNFSAKRNEKTVTLIGDPALIAGLLLDKNWKLRFDDYSMRKKFFYAWTVSDNGEDGLPIIHAVIELAKATVDASDFILEVSIVPAKLALDDRKSLEDSLSKIIEDDSFKIWWDNDPRGPRKRPLKDKNKVLDEVKALPTYSGSNDLKLEDVNITFSDALKYFGFDVKAKPKDVKKNYKKVYRELQLKYHPDSDSGNEEAFLHLQNCRDVLEEWIKK